MKNIIIILLILIAIIIIAISSGIRFIAPWYWQTNSNQAIIIYLRVPRVLSALLCGSALATAGAASQALFRNPLASSDILGISSGGSLGALLAITLGWSTSSYIAPLVASFIGCLVITLLLLAINHHATGYNTLILSALALSTLTNALISLLLLFRREYEIASFYYWLMGSLENRQYGHLLFTAPLIVLSIIILQQKREQFNLLAYGTESAQSLGLNITHFSAQILLLSSLLVASAVSIAGPIGFVGLMAPHFARFFIGYHHKHLFTLSALIGALLLLVSDTIGRTLFSPVEIKAGIIMSIMGSIYFLLLLSRKRELGYQR